MEASTPRRGKKRRVSIFEACNYLFFSLIALVMVFPIWNVLVISLASYREYVQDPLMLWPQHLDFSAYQYIFSTDEIMNAMGVSLVVTAVGTVLSMLLTIGAAYALSKKDLPGRGFLFTVIMITMFFNGGIIPTFILVGDLHLKNTIWAMILPLAVNTWYLIIMKNFFRSLPADLEEAARIDGAGDWRILAQIVLPISKPILATIGLFYCVERWNEWWSALMYINDVTKYPLQMVLRNLIVNSTPSAGMSTAYAQATDLFVAQESVKMATAVVAIVPISLVYPFLQKYFAQGVMVGAIKS